MLASASATGEVIQIPNEKMRTSGPMAPAAPYPGPCMTVPARTSGALAQTLIFVSGVIVDRYRSRLVGMHVGAALLDARNPELLAALFVDEVSPHASTTNGLQRSPVVVDGASRL